MTGGETRVTEACVNSIYHYYHSITDYIRSGEPGQETDNDFDSSVTCNRAVFFAC